MRFEAREVTVRYSGSPRPALAGVSMTIPSGDFYAILGPNGSGKSTLMRSLLGSVHLESGQVELEGRPVAEWNRKEMARSIGAVPQMERIAFPLTVLELVEMGRYPHLGPLRSQGPSDHDIVFDALRRCDALEFAHRDVGTLSGGELQRVRIARALAQTPSALVLDEPTANLDIRHEMEILHLLRKSADEGMTVVLITHHLNLAIRFADRLLLLSEGKVAAEGPVEEVLREEILEAVYRWKLVVRSDAITGHPRVVPLSKPGR